MDDRLLGPRTPRREDDRLLTGRGRYVDDLRCPGVAHAAFVRAVHASARIVSIDAAGALAMPGVVAVLVGRDVVDDGVDACPTPYVLAGADGIDHLETPRPLLALDRVRFVGEPVAMVVAESEAAALDAAERVVVDWADEPAVVDVAGAAADGAPRVHDGRPGNVAYRWRKGDGDAVAAALAGAAHVARVRTRVSRVAAMPMEPRGATAWIGGDGRPVLRVSHQTPHLLRNELAAMFGLERGALRVVADDVGGSFGMKHGVLREEALVFWAARRLRRAVRWVPSRTESFLSDEHARDLDVSVELGLDAGHRFVGLRVRYDVNVGAYMSWRGAIPISNIGGIAGVYTTPAIVAEVHGWLTHTQMTAAYRGAGRPDATYAIERTIDVAAAETGVDPAWLRRRNLIPKTAMPYRTPFIYEYDCGDFERVLDRALLRSGYDGFAARREASARDGRLRGIGIACPIEVAGGPWGRTGTEWATVQAHPDGTVSLRAGSMSVGQGHDTTLSGLVAARLGIPLEAVRFAQGDTDLIANGKGNGGSSGTILAGSVTLRSVEALVELGRTLAADALEVAADDVEYADGRFRVVGTDRGLALAEAARIAEERPDRAPSGLAVSEAFSPSQATFPNGCHVCEVEVDPGTGQVTVVGYLSVEDVGRVLNPMLVEGQMHGGVAQGIGQALMEEIRYAPDGPLVVGSFMDYAMPRATDLPSIDCEHLPTPTALNPLGVKGVGEAGTVGALAATMNAVCHALRSVGAPEIDMPATPARVWQALRSARGTALPSAVPLTAR